MRIGKEKPMERTASEHGTGVHFGEECHPGYERSENQDRIVHGQTPLGTLFAISDGVGGNQDGALAAATVTAELLHALQQAKPGTSAKRALAAAVQSANTRVHNEAAPANRDGSGQRSMSATLVAVLIDTARELPVAVVAHVGDSRAYLLRDGLLSRLTTDHTAVQSLVASGAITPEQAQAHPQGSVLTRSMGQTQEVKPTVDRILLQPGDELLLCSDGLHGYVPEAGIVAEMLRTNTMPQAKASALLHLALEAGGRDNISVQVIVPDVPRSTPARGDASVAIDRAVTALNEPLPARSPETDIAASSVPPVLAAPHAAPLPASSRVRAFRYAFFAGIAIALLIGLILGAYVWWQSRPVEPCQRSPPRLTRLFIPETFQNTPSGAACLAARSLPPPGCSNPIRPDLPYPPALPRAA